MGGTVFLCKCMRKATWVSSDHTTKDKVHHIHITKRFSLLEEVRTKRLADTASDHYLVVIEMELKLKNHLTARETALQPLSIAFP